MQNHHNNLPPELERYLALCERVYQRMIREGTWPWKDDPDSTDGQDLIESEDNPIDI